ncbi:MAG: MmcQ/YjbR family DNA-binding protein [Steroidobacteraceae bacterium]
MKLESVRRFALSLPDATEEPHFESTSFRVRRKIFATVPPAGEYLHIFVSDEQREPAIAMHAEFLENLLWGGKVRGIRVLLRKADPTVVTELLVEAWLRKAPKALAASVQNRRP